MMKRVYFDTDAFRIVSGAFEKTTLRSELKDKVLLSPITLYEVWSQLTISEVLQQLQSVPNWTAEPAGLLPWPDDALFVVCHQKAPPDDGFMKKMEQAYNLSLAATSVEQLRDAASALKNALVAGKQKTAQAFGAMLKSGREQSADIDIFSDAWYQEVARRAKVTQSCRPKIEIMIELSAYHEFEMSKVAVGLSVCNYNPTKHQNDAIDAEQLIYLHDKSLTFVTCDKGFRNRVTKSPQAARIVKVAQDDLDSADKVTLLLSRLTE